MKKSNSFVQFALIAVLCFSALVPFSAQAAPAKLDQNGISPAPYISPNGTLNLPAGFSGSFDLAG